MLDGWPCKSETILLNTVDSETVRAYLQMIFPIASEP